MIRKYKFRFAINKMKASYVITTPFIVQYLTEMQRLSDIKPLIFESK